jgi:rhomboid protease GluP
MLGVYHRSVKTSFGGLSIRDALHWGANFPPQVIGPDAEWWRLITACFLHWDLSHLIFNLVALFWLGREVERLLGFIGFLTLFLCCSTLAGVATIFYYPEQMSLGASGGIYGLVGAMLILSAITRGKRLKNARRQSRVIAIWLIIALVMNVNSPWVDTASHIGGGCSGLLLGLFLAPLYAVKTLRPIHAWFCQIFGVAFTCFTVVLALTMTPPIQPIFTLLKKYSVHAQALRKSAAQMTESSPLERRAWWESEAKPKIDELERYLLQVSDLSNLDQSELHDTSSATQWSLGRLLSSWKKYLGQDFGTQTQEKTKDQQELPPLIALRLYEALILEQKTGQLLDPSWDERVTALRRFSLWRDIPRARQHLSKLSSSLVAEANSAEVRESGSLWGDLIIRERRFKVIENTLTSHPPLSLQDHLTLTQLEWVRGDLDRVLNRVQTQLRRLHLSSNRASIPELKVQARLANLWLRTLRSKLYPLDKKFSFSISEHGQLHSEGEGGFPRSSVMYLLAQSCKSRATHTQAHSWLVELFIPQDQERAFSVIAHPISI